MLHLDDDTILGLLDLPSVTGVVERAFAAWGRGEAATTQRVRASAAGGMASAMAAVLPPYCGGKVYATKNGRFTFVNVLFDIDGRVLCTLDGDALTRFRTPGACAMAIRSLGVPDATVAAIIGCGRQGWYHLEMLASELGSLREVRLFDVVPAAADAMAERAAVTGIPVSVAASAPDAVEGAEVVLTITQATAPLFPASVVGPRTLVCAVGATKYDRCEIGADVIEACSAVVCDDVEGSKVECGDLIQAANAGRFDWARAVELHAIAAGTVRVPRAGEHGPVLFETQGVALQDVAAAGLAWERHRQRHARATSSDEEEENAP